MRISKSQYFIFISSFLLIAFLLYVSIANLEQLNRVVADFLKYLNLLVTPLGIILGIILGYPLLKKKLIENYVTKQHDIMYEANRTLRKKCLQLIEKYPSAYISTELEEKYVQQALEDIKKLTDDAFDANPEAHKYAMLLLNTLQEFSKEKHPKAHEYNETLSTFLNLHIHQIYNHAKSLGTSLNTNIRQRNYLVNRLAPFVNNNKFIEFENIDLSLSYSQSSPLLVVFFSNTFLAADSDSPFLFLAAYKAVPSPCPIARLMYNRQIYLPPVLAAPEPIFGDRKLSLIGFKRRKNTNISSGKVTHSYTCYYANITNCGFVEGTITNEQSLKEFADVYIKSLPFDFDTIKDFKKFDHEIIGFKIDETELNKAFQKNKRRLIRQLKKEL